MALRRSRLKEAANAPEAVLHTRHIGLGVQAHGQHRRAGNLQLREVRAVHALAGRQSQPTEEVRSCLHTIVRLPSKSTPFRPVPGDHSLVNWKVPVTDFDADPKTKRKRRKVSLCSGPRSPLWSRSCSGPTLPRSPRSSPEGTCANPQVHSGKWVSSCSDS